VTDRFNNTRNRPQRKEGFSVLHKGPSRHKGGKKGTGEKGSKDSDGKGRKSLNLAKVIPQQEREILFGEPLCMGGGGKNAEKKKLFLA